MSRRSLLLMALLFVAAVGAGLALRFLGLAGPGEPCAVDGDCRGGDGICLESHLGRACTTRCEASSECRPSWICREADVDVDVADGSVARVCAPPKPDLDSLRDLDP